MLAIIVSGYFLISFFNNNRENNKIRTINKTTLNNALASLDSLETLSFKEDKTVFPNPEKGFYRMYHTDDIWGFDKLRSKNITMVFLAVDLQNFKTGPISDAKLNEIRNALNSARKNGIKIIFRAAYDFDGVIAPEPTDINILLNHINQLKPIFTEYEDVIYVVQAGFLGSWGEWHSTVYGKNPKKYNDIPTDIGRKVVNALLATVPKSRMIQIRTPEYIRDLYPGTLNDQTAFNETPLARIGFHNDGLFYDETDCGTYNAPEYNRAKELEWANNHLKYTPFGGESNGLSSYSDPNNAVSELEKLHAQYLNIDYYKSVITKWQTTTYNGENTFDYISRRLGYNFLLTSAKISSKMYVGGVMHLQLNIKNDGFGNLVNERKPEIILSNGNKTYKATVNEDLRRWYRENDVMSKDLYFTIPSNIEAGTYNVYLNLPDISPNLKDNPNYSIRLANTGIWQASTGYNLLKSGVEIENIGLKTNNTTFKEIDRENAEKIMGIEVKTPVMSVSLDTSSLRLNVGETFTLTATVLPSNATEKSITYTSSNPSIATVDKNGKVTAISKGTATITVTTLSEGKTATCKVTVNQLPTVIPVQSIIIDKDNINLFEGETTNVSVTINPADATNKDISFTSSNPKIVTVDKNGKLTAISPGTTTIVATSIGEGKSTSCTVTVSKKVVEEKPTPTVPTTGGNLAELSTGNVKTLSASNDKDNLYLKVTGKNLKTKSQFYIDIDNNYNTGFKTLWENSGIEYLVENDNLYIYSGKNNKWDWTKVTKITMNRTDSEVSVTIPLSKLKLSKGSRIHIGFLSNDDKSKGIIPERKKSVVAYTLN